MVQRVILDTSGLRVSKPGVNVLTAGPLELAFNSSFSQLGRYAVGELDVSWSDPYNWVEVGFGKVFPSPPIVHLQRVISAGECDELSPVGSFFKFGDGNGANHEIFIETSASALRIRSFHGPSAPNFRLRYTIMDYNL